MFFLAGLGKRPPGGETVGVEVSRRIIAKGWQSKGLIDAGDDGFVTLFGPADTDSTRCHAGRFGDLVVAGDFRLDTIEGVAHSDAPLAAVAAAYRRFDSRLPHMLRGDFAGVVLDVANRRLLAFTDHLGVHPLYWRETSHSLAVSNIPSGFSALPDGNGRPDLDAMRDYSRVFGAASDRTFEMDRRRLLPGHLLTASGRRAEAETRQYWHPRDVTPLAKVADREAVHEAERLVAQAVSRRLPHEGNVGLEASGGLDSMLVAGVMKRVMPAADTRVVPASMVFPEWALPYLAQHPRHRNADPRRAAAESLREIGLPAPHFVENAATGYVDRRRRFSMLTEAGWVPPNVGGWLYPVFCAAGANIVLTGFGGDEAFSHGGSQARQESAAQRRYLRLLSQSRDMGKPGLHLIVARAANALLECHAPALHKRLRRRGPRHNTEKIFIPTLMGYLAADGSPEEEVRESLKTLYAARLDARRSVRADMVHRLTDGLFVRSLEGQYLDAALQGLDIRHPLLDLDLVAFCLSLPGDQFSRHGQSRYLLRRVGAGTIPEQFLKNFGPTPHGASLTRAQFWAERQEILDFLKRSKLNPRAARYFDIDKLIRFWEDKTSFDMTPGPPHGVEWGVPMLALNFLASVDDTLAVEGGGYTRNKAGQE